MKNQDKTFTDIQENFLSGQILEFGLKDAKTNALIGLACLTAIQTMGEIPGKVKEAVQAGASVTEIKETMYQTAPYIGFPRIKEALSVVNTRLEAEGMNPEKEDQSMVTSDTRFKRDWLYRFRFLEIPSIQCAPMRLLYIAYKLDTN